MVRLSKSSSTQQETCTICRCVLEAPMSGGTAFIGAHTMQVTPKLVGRQWAYSYLAVGMGLSCDDITNTALSVRPASSTSKLHVNRQAFRLWHKGDGQGNRPPIIS